MVGTIVISSAPESFPFTKLEATYIEIASSLNTLSFDQKYFPHLVSIALLNNCLEAALAIVFLSRAPTDGGHIVLLRTLFESTARLMFVARSPEDNALILEKIDCTEILRQIGKFPSKEESEETVKLRSMVSERIVALDLEKIEAVSFKKILEEIEQTSLYSIYGALSGVTHGQISPLLLQMFVDRTNGVKLEFLRRFPEEKRNALQEVAIALLQLAQLNTQRILGRINRIDVK